MIWPDVAKRPSADALKQLHRRDLWAKYEVRDATQVNDKISRYLQHCTEQRVDGKSWNVREMFEELDPLMSAFEKYLPDETRPWEKPPSRTRGVVAMRTSYSTATPKVVLGQNPIPAKRNESD
jgi:hypothetical protein